MNSRTTPSTGAAASMRTPNQVSARVSAQVSSRVSGTARSLFLALALAPLLAGCTTKSDFKESGEFFKKIFRKETYSLYRPDIQQGNTVDPAKLAQLKLGMSKKQARYLLGNPIAENVFHRNRWVYTYYLIPGRGERRRYQLVLFFSENRLYKIRKSKEIAELERKPRKKSKPRRSKREDGS